MAARGKRAVGSARRTARAGVAKPLALGSSLTIAEVGERWQSMTAMLDAGRAEADGSALATVDTAGLQLLLASGRAAVERGLRLKVRGAEELLLSAAVTLGLDAALREVLEFTP